MIKVAKFGGSSLASPEQFQKVKKIVKTDQSRQIVIVSALGKSINDDNKITDLLYLLAAHLKYKVDYHDLWQSITKRYYDILKELAINYDLAGALSEIEEQFSSSNIEEYLVSRGEYLTAQMMAHYLDYEFVDAKDLIAFNYDGTVNNELTKKHIQKAYDEHPQMVIPGFYGCYPNGDIKLFSRGGSDITGALVAQAVNAAIYENWTDVSGILMTDPKIVDNPKKIKTITYDELRELSYMGASVLHEETIFPIQELSIPIHILNTNDPSAEGTIISNAKSTEMNIITGIAGKKGFKSLTISKKRTTNKLEVMQNVLTILAKYHVNVEHLPTSIDSFSVIVESKQIDKCMYEVIGEIKTLSDVTDVVIDDDISLIAVVGRNMATRPGISGQIFAIFGSNQINIKMIAQGAQEINIIVGIATCDFEKSIKAIYRKMVQ